MSISAAAPWAYAASLRVRKAPRDPLVAAIRIGTGPAGPTETELYSPDYARRDAAASHSAREIAVSHSPVKGQ